MCERCDSKARRFPELRRSVEMVLAALDYELVHAEGLADPGVSDNMELQALLCLWAINHGMVIPPPTVSRERS